MLSTLGLLLLPVLVQEDAAALLERTRAALAAGPLEISFALSFTQALTWESHLADGTLVRDAAGERWRVDASVREIRGETGRRVTLWRDGERYVFADHDARTFVEGDHPVLGGLASSLAATAAAVLPAAPETLLEPRIDGTVDLAGRACAKVVARSEGPTQHVWYLDREAALPRLWETDRDLGEGDLIRRRFTARSIRAAAAGPEPPSLEGYEQVAPEPWDDPEARERAADFGVFTSLEGGIEPFRERFNAEKGRVRAVGLFAPT